MNNYYEQINKVLISYEENKPYHIKTIDWVASRIDWCWKWRKITKEQMEELAGRAIKIFERDIA